MSKSRIKIKGLNQIKKNQKELTKIVKKLEKGMHPSFSELFTGAFMEKYTNFASIDEMLIKFGCDPSSQEQFEAIPEMELDECVSKNTKFNTWQEMLDKASDEYLIKKCKF